VNICELGSQTPTIRQYKKGKTPINNSLFSWIVPDGQHKYNTKRWVKKTDRQIQGHNDAKGTLSIT